MNEYISIYLECLIMLDCWTGSDWNISAHKYTMTSVFERKHEGHTGEYTLHQMME